MERTNRSAKAFKFGLRAGKSNGFTPLSRSRRRNAAVKSGSRSVHAAEEPVVGIGQVPRDLFHPRLGRLTRDARDLHCACLQPHHEKDEVADESTERQHLDREEVGRGERVPVSGEKN